MLVALYSDTGFGAPAGAKFSCIKNTGGRIRSDGNCLPAVRLQTVFFGRQCPFRRASYVQMLWCKSRSGGVLTSIMSRTVALERIFIMV